MDQTSLQTNVRSMYMHHFVMTFQQLDMNKFNQNDTNLKLKPNKSSTQSLVLS